MHLRKAILCLVLLGCCTTSFSQNLACPDIKTIQRVSGEFAWVTSQPGWEGYFAIPRFGRGHSDKIKFFKEARWLQLSNLNDATGVLECDYQGTYDDEVIRFVLSLNQTAQKPTGQNWACNFNPEFVPGPQCKCTGEASTCGAKPSN